MAATMATSRSRVLDLLKLRATIFNTSFNPTQARLGTRILRQRLRGPALVKYYPPRINPVTLLRKEFKNVYVPDEAEEERLDKVELRKTRGKGTPKKRTAAESKKLTKRKPKG